MIKEKEYHKTDIRWGIELKENGKLIGDCGILLKHGFTHEGFLREYEYVWHRSVYIDADIYGLLDKDYQCNSIDIKTKNEYPRFL
jgi:hypothetical protein